MCAEQTKDSAHDWTRTALTILRQPSDRQVTILSLLLILLGSLMRLAWGLRGHMRPVNSEAFFIARALAEGRGFSEAFGLGTGPTAHLMPLTPLPAAIVYRLLGAGTPAAELVLMVLALAFVGGSFFLGERILRELGSPGWARVCAVGAVSLLPIQISLEASNLRVWESGMAAFALLLVLLIALRLDQRPDIPQRTLFGLGAGNGLIFLINPAAALATSAIIGLLFLRRVPIRRWFAPVLAAAGVVAVVLIPWGLRNEAVLGKFVPLRTGAGMSMAMAYHDGRLDAADVQAADLARFVEVSPLMGDAARQRYLEVGELAYNRELGAQARAWIKAHPVEVWKIRARNFVEFYAPPAWLWTRFTTSSGSLVEIRRAIVMVLSLVAALTIAQALISGRFRWLYVAAAVLAPSLPYIMTYPLLRYRYLVSTLLIVIAVDGGFRLLAWTMARSRNTPRALG